MPVTARKGGNPWKTATGRAPGAPGTSPGPGAPATSPARGAPRASPVPGAARTWQGYLVTAGAALFALLIGTVAKGHHHHSSLILLAIIPAVAIPLIIRVIQRR
jgi:hypothetical protein